MPKLPATEKQINYLKVLYRRLQELLDELDRDTLPPLPETSQSNLSRGDASDLIEVMKAAVEKLTEDPRPRPASKPERSGYEVPFVDLVPAELPQSEEVLLADPVKEGEDLTYDERELLLFMERFGGARTEPPAQGRRWITVYKREPNRVASYRHGMNRGADGILYGWAWICRHPNHQSVDGKPKPVRGRASTGWQQCMRNAAMHFYKHHREKDR